MPAKQPLLQALELLFTLSVMPTQSAQTIHAE